MCKLASLRYQAAGLDESIVSGARDGTQLADIIRVF